MKIFLLLSVFAVLACSENKDPRATPVFRASADGSNGKNCWEAPGMSDRNGDGRIDILDCIGPAGQVGPEGVAGQNCWDDLEDPNGDGVNDAADCLYLISKPVIYSAKDILEFNTDANKVLMLDKAETTIIHIQKPSAQGNTWYCLNINIEKPCGDEDGCSMIFKVKDTASSVTNDNVDARHWVVLAEHYDHFFNPANENQEFNERASGKSYRSLFGGGGSSSDRTAITGFSGATQTTLAFGPNENLRLKNHTSSACGNISKTGVHAQAHQFTLELHANFLGTLVIKNRP
jgi:hypothetical protein